MAINWNEINEIKRVTPEHEPKERSNISASVQDQLNKFDKLACEGNPTEADFHQDHEKVMDIQKRNYLQKAFAQTLRWQSFCRTNH